jgi:hypothetical protein
MQALEDPSEGEEEEPSSSKERSARELASSANGLKPICKFYKKRTGNCKFGDECKLKFWHPCDGPRVVQERQPSACQPHAVVKWNEFMGDMDGCHRGQDLDETVKLCSAWINRGTCHRGNACNLRHGTLGVAIGKARALWAAERRKRRAELPSTPGIRQELYTARAYLRMYVTKVD